LEYKLPSILKLLCLVFFCEKDKTNSASLLDNVEYKRFMQCKRLVAPLHLLLRLRQPKADKVGNYWFYRPQHFAPLGLPVYINFN